MDGNEMNVNQNERVAGLTPPTTRVTGTLNLDRGKDKVSLKLDYLTQPGQNPFDKLVELVTNSDSSNTISQSNNRDLLQPFPRRPQQPQQLHYQSSQPYYPISAGLIDRGEA